MPAASRAASTNQAVAAAQLSLPEFPMERACMNTSIFWEIQFTPQGVRKRACFKDGMLDASHEVTLNELLSQLLGLLGSFLLECAPIIRRGCRKSCLTERDGTEFHHVGVIAELALIP